MKNLLVTALSLPLYCATPAASGMSGEWSGVIASEMRLFMEEAQYKQQSDESLSISTNVDYYRDWSDGDQRFALSAFYRHDSADNERSHSDIRELYWRKRADNINIYLGVRKIFWGSAETVHLVDIINQEDLVENFDGEDKLGQPMINISMENDWGTFEVFSLLGFRERTFPGKEGRLHGELSVDTDNPLYQSDRKDKHVDYAIRWSQVLGDWDVGLSHFYGTSRDPILLASSQGNKLIPYYPLINQSGVDIQATLGAWLLKLEAISIDEKKAGRSNALVAGGEYTIVGIADSTADLGWLAEYQYDDRRGNRRTSAQNDLAIGARLTLNDMNDTKLLFLIVYDLDYQSRFISLEASHRLSNNWAIESEIRLFNHISEQDILWAFKDENYLQVEIKRFF